MSEEIKECYKINFWKSFGNIILYDKVKEGGINFNNFFNEIKDNINIFYIDEPKKQEIFNISKILYNVINYNYFNNTNKIILDEILISIFSDIKLNDDTLLNFINHFQYKEREKNKRINKKIIESKIIYSLYKENEELKEICKSININEEIIIKYKRELISIFDKHINSYYLDIMKELNQIICPLLYENHGISLSIIKLKSIDYNLLKSFDINIKDKEDINNKYFLYLSDSNIPLYISKEVITLEDYIIILKQIFLYVNLYMNLSNKIIIVNLSEDILLNLLKINNYELIKINDFKYIDKNEKKNNVLYIQQKGTCVISGFLNNILLYDYLHNKETYKGYNYYNYILDKLYFENYIDFIKFYNKFLDLKIFEEKEIKEKERIKNEYIKNNFIELNISNKEFYKKNIQNIKEHINLLKYMIEDFERIEIYKQYKTNYILFKDEIEKIYNQIIDKQENDDINIEKEKIKLEHYDKKDIISIKEIIKDKKYNIVIDFYEFINNPLKNLTDSFRIIKELIKKNILKKEYELNFINFKDFYKKIINIYNNFIYYNFNNTTNINDFINNPLNIRIESNDTLIDHITYLLFFMLINMLYNKSFVDIDENLDKDIGIYFVKHKIFDYIKLISNNEINFKTFKFKDNKEKKDKLDIIKNKIKNKLKEYYDENNEIKKEYQEKYFNYNINFGLFINKLNIDDEFYLNISNEIKDLNNIIKIKDYKTQNINYEEILNNIYNILDNYEFIEIENDDLLTQNIFYNILTKQFKFYLRNINKHYVIINYPLICNPNLIQYNINTILINEEKKKIINDPNINNLEQFYHFDIININKSIIKKNLILNPNDNIDKFIENNCYLITNFDKYNNFYHEFTILSYYFIKLYNDVFIKNNELLILFNELTHKTLINRDIKILYTFINNILFYKLNDDFEIKNINKQNFLGLQQISDDIIGGEIKFYKKDDNIMNLNNLILIFYYKDIKKEYLTEENINNYILNFINLYISNYSNINYNNEYDIKNNVKYILLNINIVYLFIYIIKCIMSLDNNSDLYNKIIIYLKNNDKFLEIINQIYYDKDNLKKYRVSINDIINNLIYKHFIKNFYFVDNVINLLEYYETFILTFKIKNNYSISYNLDTQLYNILMKNPKKYINDKGEEYLLSNSCVLNYLIYPNKNFKNPRFIINDKEFIYTDHITLINIFNLLLTFKIFQNDKLETILVNSNNILINNECPLIITLQNINDKIKLNSIIYKNDEYIISNDFNLFYNIENTYLLQNLTNKKYYLLYINKNNLKRHIINNNDNINIYDYNETNYILRDIKFYILPLKNNLLSFELTNINLFNDFLYYIKEYINNDYYNIINNYYEYNIKNYYYLKYKDYSDDKNKIIEDNLTILKSIFEKISKKKYKQDEQLIDILLYDLYNLLYKINNKYYEINYKELLYLNYNIYYFIHILYLIQNNKISISDININIDYIFNDDLYYQDKIKNNLKLIKEHSKYNFVKYIEDNNDIIIKTLKLFESLSGFNIRDKQFEIIFNILNEFYIHKCYREDDDNDKDIEDKELDYYNIYQLLMGSGKSSVISPVICILTNILFNFNFIFITLKQLIKDNYNKNFKQYNILFTKNIKYNENNNLTNNDFKNNNLILSIDDLKYYFSKDFYIYNDKTILLIDEIDSVFDPIKSDYNIIENTKELNDIELKNIIEFIFNDDNKKLIRSEYIKKLNEIINKDFNITDYNVEPLLNYQLYLNYMFSNINKFNIIPVEYTNKPLEGSKFNNIYDEIILTIKAFYEYKDNMRKEDINNFNNIFKNIIFNYDEKSKDIKYKFIYNEKININDYKKYIEYIIKNNLKITEQYYNYNNLDVINNKLILYKSGFSGTTDITYYLPINNILFNDKKIIENIYKYEYKNIIIDIDLENNILIKNNDVIIEDIEGNKILDNIFERIKDDNIKYINDLEFLKELNEYENILNYIKKYRINCLIDTYGFFKNKSSEEIINDVFKFNIFDKYIYIDDEDNIIYKNKENINKIFSNEYNFDENICFTYFSQKNIIGTNINLKYNKEKDYNILLLINNNTNLDLFYQSFYRDRNIQNLNHNIHIIYLNTKEYIENYIINKKEYINNYIINEKKYINDYIKNCIKNKLIIEFDKLNKLEILYLFLEIIKEEKNYNKQILNIIQNIRTNNRIDPYLSCSYSIDLNSDIILINNLLNNDLINEIIDDINNVHEDLNKPELNLKVKNNIINLIKYLQNNYNKLNSKNIIFEKEKNIEKDIEKEKELIKETFLINNNLNLRYIFTYLDNSKILYDVLDVFNLKIYLLSALYITLFKYYYNYLINNFDDLFVKYPYKQSQTKFQISLTDEELNLYINYYLFNHPCFYCIDKDINVLLKDLNKSKNTLNNLYNLNDITNITLLFNLLKISLYEDIKLNDKYINCLLDIFKNIDFNYSLYKQLFSLYLNDKNIIINTIIINNDNPKIFYKNLNENIDKETIKQLYKNTIINNNNIISSKLIKLDNIKDLYLKDFLDFIDYFVIYQLNDIYYLLITNKPLINKIISKLNNEKILFGGNNYNYYLKYLNLKQQYLNKKKKKF